MNKTEAAEFLNVSTRGLERYVAAGKIGGHYERGKTGKVLTFDESELQRFKDELEAPTSRAIALPDKARQAPKRQGATQPTSRALAKPDAASNALSIDVLGALAEWARDNARQAAPAIPIEAKPLLSLIEAQALTGLSRNTLRAAIDAGKLKAQRIGKGWKVKRRDLDSWIEKL
jgi:excisionase family DNA binding protein